MPKHAAEALQRESISSYLNSCFPVKVVAGRAVFENQTEQVPD